jgi:hypothetical protein
MSSLFHWVLVQKRCISVHLLTPERLPTDSANSTAWQIAPMHWSVNKKCSARATSMLLSAGLSHAITNQHLSPGTHWIGRQSKILHECAIYLYDGRSRLQAEPKRHQRDWLGSVPTVLQLAAIWCHSPCLWCSGLVPRATDVGLMSL